MRIQILSDLHLDIAPFDAIEDPAADILVLAGDIARGTLGLEWAISSLSKPVIYVPGNHEYYEQVRPTLLRRLKRIAQKSHVFVLDRESVVIDGVQFFGTTLWSDFDFYETPELDMTYAQRNVLDFHIIEEDTNQLFSPMLAAAEFEQSAAWLDAALGNSSATRKVVITHHAPSAKSVVPRFAGNPLNPAFASRLDWLVEKYSIDLWVHGHMHTALDYELHGTRIVCNPRGYQPYESDNGFEPCKIIEIASKLEASMSTNGEPDFEISCGNVFADLGLPDADNLFRLSTLMAEIQLSIQRLNLNNKQAASRIGISEEELTSILTGPFDAITEDVLKGYLANLGGPK